MAVRLNNIFPECYVDTNIMKTLLHVDGVNHKMSCTKVLSEMAGRFADRFAVGVIDDDKKKPSGINEFKEMARSSHLALFKHATRKHYLIIVSKAAEDLILSSAQELGIKMSDFGLPETLDGLKSITKDCESDKEPRIKRVISAVSEASEMSRLHRTISYLKGKQFKADDKELVEIFKR